MTTMAGLGMPVQVGCGAAVTSVAVRRAAATVVAAVTVGPGGWGDGASCSLAAALGANTDGDNGRVWSSNGPGGTL